MQTIFVSGSGTDLVRLTMSPAEFTVAHQVAAHIKCDFEGKDFGILMDRTSAQVDALVSSLQRVIDDNAAPTGDIAFELSRNDYEILSDAIFFAEGHLDDEFRGNLPTIAQMLAVMSPP